MRVIAFDGDDTLWHNESLLWEAEQKYHRMLERYMPAGDLQNRLFETEMRNLRLFGYGVKAFTLSMIETAIEVSEGRVATSEIQGILDFGKDLLAHPVDLIDGARNTLERLSSSYELMLITKGELLHQEIKIARSGLADMFTQIEIVSEKDRFVYESILDRHRIDKSELLMVGNSVRSDIIPIVELGARAVHIPYHVTWQHEVVDADHLPPDRVWRIERLSELPDTLDAIEATETQRP